MERHPWLAPPEDCASCTNNTSRGWRDERSARPEHAESDEALADKLAALLEEELPSFLRDIGRENLKTARTNRRVSWVEMKQNDRDESYVNFATRNGRVVLIGDAAHAVTSRHAKCSLTS